MRWELQSQMLGYWWALLEYWMTDCTEETGMEELKCRYRSNYVMLAAARDTSGSQMVRT
jgi:hypothetical protein